MCRSRPLRKFVDGVPPRRGHHSLGCCAYSRCFCTPHPVPPPARLNKTELGTSNLGIPTFGLMLYASLSSIGFVLAPAGSSPTAARSSGATMLYGEPRPVQIIPSVLPVRQTIVSSAPLCLH